MAEHSKPVAGIDTGKARLNIALQGRTGTWQVANDPAGWRSLISRLQADGVAHVGIEASGGYERGVVVALREADFRVSLHQPRQIRLSLR